MQLQPSYQLVYFMDLKKWWMKFVWSTYVLINHNWEEELSEAEKRFTACKEEAEGQTNGRL